MDKSDGMPLFGNVPIYETIVENADRVVGARSVVGTTSRWYTLVNTPRAHAADDYGEPHTPLQQAITRYDQAHADYRQAHDDLAVAAAFLTLTDSRLMQKLVDHLTDRESSARGKLMEDIFARVFKYGGDRPPNMQHGQIAWAAHQLLQVLDDSGEVPDELVKARVLLGDWLERQDQQWRAWRARRRAFEQAQPANAELGDVEA